MTKGTPASTRHSLTGTSSSSTTDTQNTNINTITSIRTSINTGSNTDTSSISTSNTSTNTGNVASASTTTGTQTEIIPETDLPPVYCWVLDGGSKSSYAKIIDQSFLQWLLVSTTGDNQLSPNRIAIQWDLTGTKTDIPVTSITDGVQKNQTLKLLMNNFYNNCQNQLVVDDHHQHLL